MMMMKIIIIIIIIIIINDKSINCNSDVDDGFFTLSA